MHFSKLCNSAWFSLNCLLTIFKSYHNDTCWILDVISTLLDVVVFTGKFLSKFKVRGGLPYGSYLGEPLGLAVLHDGSVLVSDSEKSCVHIYDENGKYQGRFGDSDLQLRQPAGMI